MNLELVKKIGAAFMSGFFYARRHDLALDAAKWITVHPNGQGINAKGDNIKGRPCLIDSETGEILGGMGGKFTGRHISAMAQKGANEQPGAQMQITARNPKHKAEAMNGQRIGFKQVNGATAQSRSDKRSKTTAATPASSYKEADERVKQIQEQQKDIDRQIHSLVSTVDWSGSGGNDTPEAKQALSQIAKLRSDYAKLNDDLGSAIKERFALEKTTEHPNFTHATTGRSEGEITSGTWKRAQARRHRNFMINTFGASGSETKETNGLKNKQPENSEISLPKPAVLKPGHLHLSVPMKIEKQTDKAVMTRDAKGNKIWLPKSQASITDTGYIAGVSDWAAKEKGIQTEKPADQPKTDHSAAFSHTGAPSGGQALAQLAKKKAAGAGNSAVSSENSGNSAIAGARAYWQSQNKKDPNVPVSASEQIKDTKIKSYENLEALSQYGHVYMDDYGHKRLYLDPETLGMEVKKTANGKLISATVNGEKLSNTKARGLLSGDTYIDLKTGELTGGHSERFNDYFRDKINNIVSENFVSG